MHRIAKQIHNQILGARKIAVIPHLNPDGDALGAVNALFEYLRILGKNRLAVAAGPLAAEYDFLPHNEKISLAPETIRDPEIDLIIIVDTGDLERTGLAEHLADHSAKIVNIDHHATNRHYGHFNLVLPDAAATTEIIYRFFRHNRISINRAMANAILTGLVTDTDNFTNSATTAMSLAVAGEMARAGANLGLIRKKTQQNRSFVTLKLWGLILSRLQKNEELNIAHTYITRADFEKFGLTEEAISGMADFLNNLEEARISLIIREAADGQSRVSLRTTLPDTDVSLIARELGGGGHIKAAGVTLPGTASEALKQVLTVCKKHIIISP